MAIMRQISVGHPALSATEKVFSGVPCVEHSYCQSLFRLFFTRFPSVILQVEPWPTKPKSGVEAPLRCIRPGRGVRGLSPTREQVRAERPPFLHPLSFFSLFFLRIGWCG